MTSNYVYINERVESLKFLGVLITKDLVHTHQQSHEEATKAPIPPQEAEKICHGPSDPQNIIQLQNQEHLDWVHHCFICQSAIGAGADTPVHHWG